jgi:hypothetical protein
MPGGGVAPADALTDLHDGVLRVAGLIPKVIEVGIDLGIVERTSEPSAVPEKEGEQDQQDSE